MKLTFLCLHQVVPSSAKKNIILTSLPKKLIFLLIIFPECAEFDLFIVSKKGNSCSKLDLQQLHVWCLVFRLQSTVHYNMSGKHKGHFHCFSLQTDIRRFEKTTTAMSLNKRFNEQYNSCACVNPDPSIWK